MHRKLIGYLLLAVFSISRVMAEDGQNTRAKMPVDVGDITLTDGKAFRAARILSETGLAVNIRHAGGLGKIEKRLLPPELLARFPIDEQLAAREKDAAALQRQQLQAQALERKKIEQAKRVAAAAAPVVAVTSEGQPQPVAMPHMTPEQIAEAERAKAPFGLFIVSWSMLSGGEISIHLKNPTTNSYKLDPRQLTGLVLDTGQSVQGESIKYSVNEIADDWLYSGNVKTFRVVFAGGRRIGAVSWVGSQEWHTQGSYGLSGLESNTEEVIRKIRETEKLARVNARARSSRPAADAAIQEANEHLINK